MEEIGFIPYKYCKLKRKRIQEVGHVAVKYCKTLNGLSFRGFQIDGPIIEHFHFLCTSFDEQPAFRCMECYEWLTNANDGFQHQLNPTLCDTSLLPSDGVAPPNTCNDGISLNAIMTQHFFDLPDTCTNGITICPNCPHYVRNHNIGCLTHHWEHRLGPYCTITGTQQFQLIPNTSFFKLRIFICSICNDSDPYDPQSWYSEPLDPQEKWTHLVYNLVATAFFNKISLFRFKAMFRALAHNCPFTNLPREIHGNLAKFIPVLEPRFSSP